MLPCWRTSTPAPACGVRPRRRIRSLTMERGGGLPRDRRQHRPGHELSLAPHRHRYIRFSARWRESARICFRSLMSRHPAVPITPVDRNGRPRRLLPHSTRPSPRDRRIGIHKFTFEVCSGFTRVTARWIAQPPKATSVSRISSVSWPSSPTGRAARAAQYVLPVDLL